MEYRGLTFVNGGTLFHVRGLRSDSNNPEQQYVSSLLFRNKTSPMMPVVSVSEDNPSPAIISGGNVCGDPSINLDFTLRDEECASLSSPLEAAAEPIAEPATPDTIPEFSNVEPVSPAADILSVTADIYTELSLPDPDAVAKHSSFLINLFDRGAYPYPLESIDPDSATPYSDIAKPRKKGRDGMIKRPMNAFLTFAQGERQRFIEARAQLGNALISTHLGQVWHALPDRVKAPFSERARFLKELHQREFPEYKYKPQKKKAAGEPAKEKATSRRQRVRKKKAVTEETDQAAELGPLSLGVEMEVDLQPFRPPSSLALPLNVLEDSRAAEPAAISPALSITSIPSPLPPPPSAEMQHVDNSPLCMEEEPQDCLMFAHQIPFTDDFQIDDNNWEHISPSLMDNLVQGLPDFLLL